MTINELRNDRDLVENKFTETRKVKEIAAKYGVKEAGRVKMVSETVEVLNRIIIEARKNQGT
jgi:hypothetical protein